MSAPPKKGDNGYNSLLGDATNIQLQDNQSLLRLRSPQRSRIVKRSNGRSQMHHINLGSLRLSILGYVTDGFTTVMNSPWWIVIAIFLITYFFSWLFFAGMWALVAYVDGHFNNTCLENVYDFNSAFLFSVETQITIGYGNKFVQNSCGWGILFLTIQCLFGLLIDSFMLGLIFSKLTRPRNRRKTMVFSDKAVIYKKDGETFFEFRVCDIRRSQIVECHIRLILYWNRLVDPMATNEDNRYAFEQHEIECGYDTGSDRILLLTPILVRHKITESSPMYDITQSDLNSEDFEMLVILEGIVEATGLTVQALWSYTNEEVIRDHRFLTMVRRHRGQWEVDFAKVNAMEQYQS